MNGFYDHIAPDCLLWKIICYLVQILLLNDKTLIKMFVTGNVCYNWIEIPDHRHFSIIFGASSSNQAHFP